MSSVTEASLSGGFRAADVMVLLEAARRWRQPQPSWPFVDRLRVLGAVWSEPRLEAEVSYAEVVDGPLPRAELALVGAVIRVSRRRSGSARARRPASNVPDMTPRLLHIFETHVELQCFAIVLAAEQALDEALTRRQTGIRPAFCAIQSLLAGAANLSIALWGQKGSRSGAREGLRKSLGVDDNSPLRSVRMRNHYEHFDERL